MHILPLFWVCNIQKLLYQTLQLHLKEEFPTLVSYTRFIELRQRVIWITLIMLCTKKLSRCTGISFIDSFKLDACNIKRASSHKITRAISRHGKTSMGWFYGMKIHIIINHRGEIVSFYISSGNVSDNSESVLFNLIRRITGKLFGDKGHIVNQDKAKRILDKGVHLITKVRENMTNKLLEWEDKLLLRKRGVIESVGVFSKTIFYAALSPSKGRCLSTQCFYFFNCLSNEKQKT